MQGGLHPRLVVPRLRGCTYSAAHCISALIAIRGAIEGNFGYRHSPYSPGTGSRALRMEINGVIVAGVHSLLGDTDGSPRGDKPDMAHYLIDTD